MLTKALKDLNIQRQNQEEEARHSSTPSDLINYDKPMTFKSNRLSLLPKKSNHSRTRLKTDLLTSSEVLTEDISLQIQSRKSFAKKQTSSLTKSSIKSVKYILTSQSPNSIPNPLPQISAQSYAIFDLKTVSLIVGRKENLRREIASLTKMMTFYTVNELLARFNLNPDTHHIKVTRAAALTTGTTANLRVGDYLTVTQLLYAMMLPSGNDAAFCLAEHFGELLHNSSEDHGFVGSWQFGDSDVRFFLREMNQNATRLRMFSSCFDSPHGLMNKYNYSSAYDVCLLTSHCMRIPLFSEVVKTLEYSAPSRKSEAPYVWENTNKLLGVTPGFIGCKTGITDSAGPCFSGVFTGKGESICIVVLNSKSME